ncbi:uncharacterized protein LOC123563843 [Mercenaria mercenaria]|uniref:uncharacterized protein LOC123563843 n=1 Tax=Mercenaria mercenaria TaxID=6596 RepID=UPI00234E42B6|nr:uncharacterized protein LOC123563843 [Mercenaria mercenaria]XP_045212849.2 uncharacterized protein LOC123563843 [Mercenaria mercenaria]
MAERGDLPSLKDGSDVDIEFPCTPCGEDNIREEAFKYCPECQEYLCTTCTRHHGRQKATRAHKLLDRDDAKQGPLIAKTKCYYHPDQDIEMYCGTHDMVYCVMCIATEHRSCEGVIRIEDEPKSCVNQTEINRVLDETRNATDRIMALIIKQQKNKTSLEEQRNKIEEKLEKDKIRLIEHIRKLKRETSESLDKSYAKINGEIESEISVSTNMIQNLKKTSEQLQSVAGMDAVQQFIQMKLMKKTVTEANKLHADVESNGTKSVCFTENTDLITSVMSANTFGEVRTEAEEKKPSKPIQYKMKSKKEVNVRMANDKSTCVISDVCQLPDGTILLTDFSNNKVKRLDLNYSMKDHFGLDAIPTAICCIGKSQVAVKLYNGKILFISVGSTLSKTRCITIVGGNLHGMALYAEELWISTGDGVNVYNTTGTLIKSIDKDQNDKVIFNSVTQHMTASGNNIIVTDWSDGAICINKDATVMMELRDKRLKGSCGLCVSDDGTVFLCGYNSNNIVMFSSDGKCLGELIAADAGLKKPISLCYDSNKHCIITTCHMSDTIHVVGLG